MDDFGRFFTYVPEGIDRTGILSGLAQLGGHYDVSRWELPLPLWTKRPYDFTGDEVWGIISSELAISDPHRPLCLYIHIPFCTSKCGFCDSYSFKLGAKVEEHVGRYVDMFCAELALWGAIGPMNKRPVTTVHLGGGTPAFIGAAGLARLVETIRQTFTVSEATEWALETTVESLAPAMIDALESLGFNRLHLGIQTLEDEVRRLIGRRRPAREALVKAAEMRARGWIVSVDLIAGLPGQTLTGFIGGIEDLIAAGVDGFSLYELLIYPQNRRWAASYGLLERDHLPNYLMFAAGAGLLESRGLAKNLFNHWANARDENIYFTFPQREEDLLAVGTIADGVFGEVHYRHPRYPFYMKESRVGFPGLEGGLRRTPFENALKPLVTALLSGRLSPEIMSRFAARRADGLIARWLICGLIKPDGMRGLHLTTSGSWFVGNLIGELNAHAALDHARRKGDYV